MNSFFLKIILFILCTLSINSFSEDLGLWGTVYPIKEKDMITLMKEKVLEKQKNDEVNSFNQQRKDAAQKYLNRPIGVSLPNALTNSLTIIDPTYTLEEDIVDEKGKALIKKGFSFNPLAIKPVSSILCFINGDDEKQIEWMLKKCQSPSQQFKIILVEGNWFELSNKMNVTLFFDQNGYLINYFKINALPAMVKQVDEVLHVEQIKIY